MWPTFNMADCWIVIGVAALMLQMFFEEPEENADEGGAPPVDEAPAA